MQRRYVLAGFFAVVLFVTTLVSCFGHQRRSDADPVTTVLIGIVLIWMAHCTPLGKLPEGQSAEERWREHG
jgi:hypothetical protein